MNSPISDKLRTALDALLGSVDAFYNDPERYLGAAAQLVAETWRQERAAAREQREQQLGLPAREGRGLPDDDPGTPEAAPLISSTYHADPEAFAAMLRDVADRLESKEWILIRSSSTHSADPRDTERVSFTIRPRGPSDG